MLMGSQECRPAGLVRRYFLVWAVTLGACQTAMPALGDAKPIKPGDPPSQPSPTAPSLAPTTIAFVYVRSTVDNKGTSPITSITAAPGAKISVVPTSISGPGDLADITLTSTFFGKSFTYNFTNIPLDKDNNFTLDPTDAALKDQFTALYTLLLNTILAKLPVNADPRTPIVWCEPVKVQLTRIFPDGTTAASVDAAKKAAAAALDIVNGLNNAITDAAELLKAATERQMKATAKADKDIAQIDIDKANDITMNVTKALKAAQAAQTATKAARQQAEAADKAGHPAANSIPDDPKKDTRKKDKPLYTTADLNFAFQE
jgi:hypothetical protein